MKTTSISAFFTTVFGALRAGGASNDRRHVSPKTISLGTDGMLRLGRDSRVGCIEVRKGMVWLTGSPGRADVLLGEGDRYVLTEDWPFVAQSLETAEIELFPAGFLSTDKACCVA